MGEKRGANAEFPYKEKTNGERKKVATKKET